MDKDYTEWFKLKPKLNRLPNGPYITSGQIWWCSLGLNIGDEEDGKSDSSQRPILIIKKFSRNLFWGIPLTTKIKNDRNHYQFNFHNKNQCVMLTRLGLRDTRRLGKRMGQISDNELIKIRGIVKSML